MRKMPKLGANFSFNDVKEKARRVNEQAASRKDIGRTLMIPLEDIEIVSNVRTQFDETSIDELAESIKTLGQQSPITVKPHETDAGKWVLVKGERRYRAVKKLGQPTILAREDDGTHTTAKQIVENIQREDMSILDIGRPLHELQKIEGIDVKDMAALIGKDQRFVYRAMLVTELPDEIQALCIQKILRDGVAIERLMRFIRKHQDRKNWIVAEILAEVESQKLHEKRRLEAQTDEVSGESESEDILSSGEEETAVRATPASIVITRKFIAELENKLKRLIQRRVVRQEKPIPLKDEPLTLANADRLSRLKGYENYKFNGLKARITCMFMLPEAFGDEKMRGGEENPLACAQFTTISTGSPNIGVVEFQNQLYEVPMEHIIITGIYPLKDLKAENDKNDQNVNNVGDQKDPEEKE